MATIEELREQDKPKPHKPGEPFLLGGGPCVMTVIAPGSDAKPDDVALRITNGVNKDIFWTTFDGQLHFGAQALAGLTAHLVKELEGRLPNQPQTWSCRVCGCHVTAAYTPWSDQDRVKLADGLCLPCWLRRQDQRDEKFLLAPQPAFARNPFEKVKPLE